MPKIIRARPIERARSRMKLSRSSRAYLVSGFLAVVAATGAMVWYVSLPAFVWYTSRPVDSQGHRAKVLVPRGWELNSARSHLPNGMLSHDGRVTLVFEARPLKFPDWMRRLLGLPSASAARLYVDLGRSPDMIGLNPDCPTDGAEEDDAQSLFTEPGYLSYRVIKAGRPPVYGMVAVICADRRRYHAVRSIVCHSFQIE